MASKNSHLFSMLWDLYLSNNKGWQTCMMEFGISHDSLLFCFLTIGA